MNSVFVRFFEDYFCQLSQRIVFAANLRQPAGFFQFFGAKPFSIYPESFIIVFKQRNTNAEREDSG